jgi:pyruvate,water dikinase
MTAPLVVPSTGPEAREARLVGGKAANLAALESFGQRVPPWFAVTSAAFRRALESDGLAGWIAERLPAAPGDPTHGLEEIRARIAELAPPSQLRAAIEETYGKLIPDGAWVAVRSSALGEDTASDSFAGLHDSFLYLRGEDQVLDAIQRVWASAYNERAVAYRLCRGISLETIEVAVLVQEMVEATTSGVMFTVNPNSGDLYQVVISSLWGAGEGLVSAGLDADTFVVDKETLEVEVSEAVKPTQLLLDHEAGGGLREVEVPRERREVASLEPAQLSAVARAGLAIERAYGRPQDVEFSLDAEGNLFILQSRPVTTVEEYGPAAGNRLIWDNSNIIESYSGVTSPMTFSFIRHAYNIVYHCFAEVMGIHPDVVWRNRHTFQNMLGLFRGQVYYNLDNWYRLIHMFPGFNYNKKFMESMMGVRESLDSEDGETSEPSWRQRYFVELPALVRLVLRSTWNFRRIEKVVGDFERHFEKHYSLWSGEDLEGLEPHEVMALYREMEEKLLWQWKAPIINDFFVMIFYGTLKKLCGSWCGDESGSLQNDLICGEGGIASTEPTKRLMAIAVEANRQPELRRLLLDNDPESLAALLPTDSRFPGFRASIDDYLDRFGFRCVDELKLEQYSLKERPAFVYQVIRNYLLTADDGRLDPEAATQREAEIRRQAEERAFAALASRRSPLPRRAIFRRVLANARLGVRNRENMRFARTQIYGLLREMLRAIGARFQREGLLDETDDIFLLTIDEVWDFIKGTAVTTDLRGLVDLRRREFDSFRAGEDSPDDRFETFGMAYHHNRFQGRRAALAPSEDGVLRGIGCCPGVVSGPVKVLRSPSDDATLSGEILVAERTDPGWVPLYPSVSGLLIERGSILSHSAIVAREMGIPTIVGIPGLSAALQSGEVVTMDGSAGTVRQASEQHETPDSTGHEE